MPFEWLNTIMITGRQIRAARALLDWSAQTLASKVGLSREAINKIEDGSVQPRAKNHADIIKVIDAHGIEFNGERGIAFKNDQVVTMQGENVFLRLLDDVIATLINAPKPEALLPVSMTRYRRQP